jgi:hypothetical protein
LNLYDNKKKYYGIFLKPEEVRSIFRRPWSALDKADVLGVGQKAAARSVATVGGGGGGGFTSEGR